MIQCLEWSLHTVKMPKKPIKQGYQLYALAEHDYIYTFCWSSRKQGIMEMFQYPGLTSTASMVINMVERLPIPAALPAAWSATATTTATTYTTNPQPT